MKMVPLPMGIMAEKDEFSQVAPQNLINLYPVVTKNSKQPVTLKQTPGFTIYNTIGTSHRGTWIMNGIRYTVSGTALYKEFPLGTWTNVGTISGTERVGMASNDRDSGQQLIIVNGTSTAYVYTETGGLTTQTLTGPAYTVTYQDGYFIFDWAVTGKWFISSVNDGTTYDSTEAGATNSRPDNVLAVISKKEQIWVGGEETWEIYVNTGGIDFPYEKIKEVTIDDVGLGERNTLVYNDNALYFIGNDKIPYRTQGYELQIIGSEEILQALENIDLSQVTAFGFKWRSHFFYQVSLPTGITYRFDAKTSLWHTVRGYSLGYAPYRGASHHYFKGKHYLGDFENGNIYELGHDILTDNTLLIRREMITPFIHQNGNQFKVNKIRADFQMGAGNTDAPDPVVMLEFTNDGENWSTPIPAFIGKQGERNMQAWWPSLGCHYQIAYKIWWTDSVDTALLGLYGC